MLASGAATVCDDEGTLQLNTLAQLITQHETALSELQASLQQTEDRIGALEGDTFPVTVLHLEAESDQRELDWLCQSLDDAAQPAEPYFQVLGMNKCQVEALAFKPTLLRLGPERGESMHVAHRDRDHVSSDFEEEEDEEHIEDAIISPNGSLLVRAGPSRVADPTPECIRGVLGLNIDIACLRGQKHVINQDNFCVLQAHLAEPGWKRLTVLSVLDGHGDLGHLVSALLSQVLPALVLQAMREHVAAAEGALNVAQAFHTAFEMAHAELEAYASQNRLDLRKSGACALVALRLPGGDNRLHCAWVGDSQIAVISKDGDPLFMSREHDISGEEGERVLAAGGVIVDKGPGIAGAPLLRIYRKGEDGPGLAISRAFGDWGASDLGVTWVPEYGEVTLQSGCTVVLGSDGLWDCLKVDEVEGLRPNPWNASDHSWATALVRASLQRRQGLYIPADDTTCMLWMVEDE